jgi:hypothetical protein
MGGTCNTHNILVGNLKGRENFVDSVVDLKVV